MVSLIVLFCYYIYRDGNPKTSFKQVRGIVTALHNFHKDFPGKDTACYRFLSIDRYPKPFELYMAKTAGGFKQQLNLINDLRTGDSVTVFYRESLNTYADPVNNLVYFIERGNTPVFIDGNSKKYLSYGMIFFFALLILILFILKKKGTINP